MIRQKQEISRLEKLTMPKYPEDIALIGALIPSLSAACNDLQIELLWKDFSASFAASWLNVNRDSVDRFEDYLCENCGFEKVWGIGKGHEPPILG